MRAPHNASPHHRVAGWIWQAEHLLFVTGAGISADSGLPTYRGVGGLYSEGTTEEGVTIQEALSGDMLRTRPDIAWKYLWQLGSACRRGRFNRAHEVLAEIERRKPDTWVLTQNIDGYHRAAGSRNLIEIHGSYARLHCTRCDFSLTTDEWLAGMPKGTPQLPPRCPRCAAVIRPGVVLFGEALPEEGLQQLQEVLYGRPRDLVIAIGTTGQFPYIELPLELAQFNQVPTVEINPDRSHLSHLVDLHLEERAAPALDAIWGHLVG